MKRKYMEQTEKIKNKYNRKWISKIWLTNMNSKGGGKGESVR